MKKVIRITESDIRKIVMESVASFYDNRGEYENAVDNHLYYSDEMRREMLELSDDHILWRITGGFDENYYFSLVDNAIDKLSEEFGTQVYALGRSGRHVCVEDTPENRERYDEMRARVSEVQNEIINALES